MKEGLVDYKRGFSKRVAAYAAIFVVGAAVGASLFGRQSSADFKNDWYGDMASFHAIGVSISLATEEANQMFKDLSLNYDLPGLTYQSRALMTVDGEDVLSTAFVAEDGTPVVLYRVQTQNADLSEPVVGLRQGLQAATWTNSGVKHLLIGGTDAHLIWKAAKAVPEN